MTQCEHIHGDGARCLSPAMHRRSFCYMHWRLREHKLTVPEPEFQLPTIDSEASIVLASTQIASAVLAGKLDTRKARVVLACLKMAIESLRRQQDVTGITEIELTPSMHDEFTAAHPSDCELELETAPVPQLAASKEIHPPAPTAPVQDETPRNLSSRAARSAARDLLSAVPSAVPAHLHTPPMTEEELERFIDQHPLMRMKPPALAEITGSV